VSWVVTSAYRALIGKLNEAASDTSNKKKKRGGGEGEEKEKERKYSRIFRALTERCVQDVKPRGDA